MNPYETHLPVLDFIFNNIKINNVLEFGLGFGSTPYLNAKCSNLISVEHCVEWGEKFINLKYSNHEVVIYPEDNVEDILNRDNINYDLIFVDGSLHSRWRCINKSFNRTSIIVTHDTEMPDYKWGLIKLAEGYFRYDYIKLTPYTTIFTNNPYLLSIINTI